MDLFCCIQYVLVSCLRSPSGLKIYNTCGKCFVLRLEVLNTPCCKNKSWLLRGQFYLCQIDAPLTSLYRRFLDSSLKVFSHRWAWRETKGIKKWTKGLMAHCLSQPQFSLQLPKLCYSSSFLMEETSILHLSQREPSHSAKK